MSKEVVECYVVRHPDGLEPFSTHKAAITYCKTVGQDVCRIICSETELADFVASSVMVDAYNMFAVGQGKNKVVRFSDKDAAARRTWEVLAKHATLRGKPMTEETDKNIEQKIIAKAKSLVEGGVQRRRISRDAKIEKLVEANPRRVGTAGHKSWELLQPDMTVGQFLEAGGRMNDLLWDVDKLKLKLVEPEQTTVSA